MGCKISHYALSLMGRGPWPQGRWQSLAPVPPARGRRQSLAPVRNTPLAREQKSAFFAPDGAVINVCGGQPCRTSVYTP